jgi:malate permease and related proteins
VLDYQTILYAVLPVYLTMVVGAGARRFKLLPAESDAGLMRVSVNLLFPCLIFERIVGNEAVMDPLRVLLAAGLGFGLVALGIFIAYHTAPLLGLRVGQGRRTFAMSVGMQNYGFVAIPVLGALFPGKETLGVMFTFTLGVELAVWLIGVGILTGVSRSPWRAAINAPVLTILASLMTNFLGLHPYVPAPIHTLLNNLGNCSVPLSVLLIGASIFDLWGKEPINWPVAIASPILRLLVLPMSFLACAVWLPLSLELQRVLIVQAAMPAAVFGIVLARMYGGHTATAVQVILATTVASLLATPWLISLGVRWVGW